MKLPPDRGTLTYLDMLIHDCRQYLYIRAGVIDDITQEGPMADEKPLSDTPSTTARTMVSVIRTEGLKIFLKLPPALRN